MWGINTDTVEYIGTNVQQERSHDDMANQTHDVSWYQTTQDLNSLTNLEKLIQI